MSKQQRDELRRLEEALMEDSDLEGFDDFGYGQQNSQWQSVSIPDSNGRNTDRTDVDMDAYSEDVYRGGSRKGVSFLLTMLAMVAISVGILILFKLLGVL